MKANVSYFVVGTDTEEETIFEVWAFNNQYGTTRFIKSYKTKKAAVAYVMKVNARLQEKAARTK